MEIKTIKIDKGVPIPKGRPWQVYRQMEVGDSIFTTRKKYSCAVRAFKYLNEDAEFTERFVEENGVRGYRIWRTK